MLQETGVYHIICKVTGKRYIGSTRNQHGFIRRWTEHLCNLNANKHSAPHLQNAWNKYGEDAFLFQVLDILPAEDCLHWEQMYFDTCDTSTLFNARLIAAGGSVKGWSYSQNADKQFGTRPNAQGKRGPQKNPRKHNTGNQRGAK